MKYDEWLNTLKPGDTVYLNGYGFNAIRKVNRITPSRRIILQNSKSQFINGRHRIDDYNSEYIEELTDEIKIRHTLIIKLKRIGKHKLTIEEPDKINKIYDILIDKL